MSMTREGHPTPVSFDHHSADYAERWPDLFARLRSERPVARSEAYGGFFIPSRYDDVVRIARDDATFSSEHEQDGCVVGVQIPPGVVRTVPIEVDPPAYSAYRKLLAPALSPSAALRWESFTHAVTTACLDAHIEEGSIDLVLDVANPVPAILTLALLGLPLEDWERWATPCHEYVYAVPGSPEDTAAAGAVLDMYEGLATLVSARRSEPRDDLVSLLVGAEVNGAGLTDDEVIAACYLFLFGGVDTTTSLLASALVWLQDHQVERQRLIEEPSLRPAAIEEFLRYFTPVQSMARTVTCPVEVGGLVLERGDRVLLPWAAANRDPDAFPNPDDVDIERAPNPHTAFGVGIHRCLGSNLARMELEVMLGEVLERLPDYSIDLGRAARYTSIGTVNGWVSLPATFAPGRPHGSSFQL